MIMNNTSNKRRLPRWAFVVVALLAGHITLMMTAVTFAVRGYGTAGVEPDYYARAVAWDADQALLRASEALGWRVTVTPDIWQDAEGRREMVVLANDASGNAIDNAQAELIMHHAVYPTRQAEASLMPQGSGVYRADVPRLTPGLWRIDVRIVQPSSESNVPPTEWYGRFDQQITDVVALGNAESELANQPQ